MSWLYEPKRPVPTKHNGVMELSRWLGAWTLWGHDGTFQGAPYMDGVWKKTLRAVRRRGVDVRRVLILGVAMGSTFGIVQHAWPDADIVGVDWEPAIFELGKKLGVFVPGPKLHFIEGDAAEVVPKLEGAFDLIVIDLFNGRIPTQAIINPALQDAVARLLAPGGMLAINVYRQQQMLDGWKAKMGQPSMLKYVANHVAIFTRQP